MLRKISELFSRVPPGPWRVVRRSSPGWRLEESRESRLLAYGPEVTNDDTLAQLMVLLRDEWPHVVEEIYRSHGDVFRLVNLLAESEAREADLARRNAQLVEFVIDAGDYFEEWNEPDWFLLRARELTSGADGDAAVRPEGGVQGR